MSIYQPPYRAVRTLDTTRHVYGLECDIGRQTLIVRRDVDIQDAAFVPRLRKLVLYTSVSADMCRELAQRIESIDRLTIICDAASNNSDLSDTTDVGIDPYAPLIAMCRHVSLHYFVFSPSVAVHCASTGTVQSLTLRYTDTLDAPTALQLAAWLPALTSVTFREGNVCAAVAATLCNALPQLTGIAVVDETALSVPLFLSLLQCRVRLKRLAIVRGRGFHAPLVLSDYVALECLRLDGVRRAFNDHAMATLLQGSRRLVSLYVVDCECMTIRFLFKMLRDGGHPTLGRLVVVPCVIDPFDLVLLYEYMRTVMHKLVPRLHRVVLRHLPDMDDVVARGLAPYYHDMTMEAVLDYSCRCAKRDSAFRCQFTLAVGSAAASRIVYQSPSDQVSFLEQAAAMTHTDSQVPFLKHLSRMRSAIVSEYQQCLVRQSRARRSDSATDGSNESITRRANNNDDDDASRHKTTILSSSASSSCEYDSDGVVSYNRSKSVTVTVCATNN
jgi:hypothetical protein